MAFVSEISLHLTGEKLVTASGFLMGRLTGLDMTVLNERQIFYLQMNIQIYYYHHSLYKLVIWTAKGMQMSILFLTEGE